MRGLGDPAEEIKKTEPEVHDEEAAFLTNAPLTKPTAGPIIHQDPNAVLAKVEQERDRDLLAKRKQEAREEETKELEELMKKQQPAVPKGWDYLILPRKINLLRVKPPPTIMEDDYFKSVKALVSAA